MITDDVVELSFKGQTKAVMIKAQMSKWWEWARGRLVFPRKRK